MQQNTSEVGEPVGFRHIKKLGFIDPRRKEIRIPIKMDKNYERLLLLHQMKLKNFGIICTSNLYRLNNNERIPMFSLILPLKWKFIKNSNEPFEYFILDHNHNKRITISGIQIPDISFTLHTRFEYTLITAPFFNNKIIIMLVDNETGESFINGTIKIELVNVITNEIKNKVSYKELQKIQTIVLEYMYKYTQVDMKNPYILWGDKSAKVVLKQKGPELNIKLDG